MEVITILRVTSGVGGDPAGGLAVVFREGVEGLSIAEDVKRVRGLKVDYFIVERRG